MNQVRMPQKVDDPLPFIFFEIDDVVVLVLCITVGIVIRELTYTAILGLFAVRIFGKWKTGKLQGVLAHMGYWYGLLGLNKTFSGASGSKFIE